MTLTALDIERMKKVLAGENIALALSLDPGAKPTGSHLSGKDLVSRWTGILTDDQAKEIEQHINESCENEND